MDYKFYVVGKFYDNGKVESQILTAEEAKEKNCFDGFREDTEKYDLYVDGAKTMKDDPANFSYRFKTSSYRCIPQNILKFRPLALSRVRWRFFAFFAKNTT